MVEVTVRPNDGGSFTTPFYLNPGYSLTATTIDGSSTTYEIYNLEKDDYGNETSKIDYGSSIEIPAENFVKVKAFSGTTISKNYVLDAKTQTEKFIYNISDIDIIENSIRIYYQYGTLEEVELIETDSFVVVPKITTTFTQAMGGIPHYKIRYNNDGSAKIIFGSREFGGSFPIPQSGQTKSITIFYRTGGGLLSNVARGGINQVINITVDNFNTLPISFYNFLGGGGGSNRESLDEAQFYAPLRIGRTRSIIDDIDAQNELRTSSIKHKVVSPKYNGINVPLLHYHNYIVPPRVFDNFLFPVPNSTDTYLSYKNIFELELNKFLNLDGIHDGAENDVLISFFRTTDFSFPLPFKPPLNGSLYVSAYDSSGKEVDRLIWGGNYSGSTNLPDPAISNAKVVSEEALGNISLVPGKQFLYFNIDNQVGSTTVNGNPCYKIEIPVTSYGVDINGKATALASRIDEKIRTASTYYASFNQSTPFAYIDDDKKLVIRSLSTGTISKIQVFNPSDSVLTDLLIIPQYQEAYPQNRKSFLETSIYNYDTHQITLRLNSTEFLKSKTYDNLVSAWPDVNLVNGPTIILSFKDKNNNPVLLREGSSLIITAITNQQTFDILTFSNISNTGENNGVAGEGVVFDDTISTLCKYDYQKGQLTIKLTDSNGTAGDYSFPVGTDGLTEFYNTSTEFLIEYEEKIYNLITVSMIPNPYEPESEALDYILKLKSKDKKMIGVEPLLKRVVFKPILLDISITPAKGYSREQAILDTTNLIYSSFTYNTMIEDINIGSGFTLAIVESYLNNKIRLPSVEKAKINLPSSNLTDANDNQYYFIFNETFLGRIRNLEQTYTQLIGLYDSYKLRVKIA